jgi:two-component system phosphate regulon response regulator PhoB
MSRLRTVLVADDNPHMRLLLEKMLRKGPYDVLQSSDGGQTLRVAREQHPDLVLLDAEMPVVHGFEVCRQLKADPATRSIQIVMLTAKAQEEDRNRGLACGADAYIAKPFSPRELLVHLAACFAEPQPRAGTISGGLSS